MSARGRALAAGLAVAAVYAASAAWSGHLSPLARRPLLDGLAPPAPYRWVEPPPELAGENVVPSGQRFDVPLGEGGSETTVLTTDDAQVTVILAERSFAAAAGQRSVRVRVEPLAPSAVEPPAAPTQIVGNVYLLEAAYAPSGEPAPLEVDARVVLVYPLLSGDHGGHEVLVSRRGTMWTAVDTNDLVSIQQADGPIDSLGYVAVGGSPAATVTPSPSGEPEDDGSSLATFVIVASIAVLVIGVAVALWPRRPSRPAARGGRGSRRFR